MAILCLHLYIDLAARHRCFPHVINIAAKTGLKALTKIPSESRNREEDEDHDASTYVPEDDSLFDDGLSTDPNDNTALQHDPTYLDSLEDDPVATARKIVKYVRASGQRREKFFDAVKTVNTNRPLDKQLKHNMLLLDVVTRWSATYLMIDRVLEQSEVSNSHTRSTMSRCTNLLIGYRGVPGSRESV